MVSRAPDFAIAPSLLTLSPGDTARLTPRLNLQPTGDVQFLSRGTSASVTAAGLVTALTPGVGAVTAVAMREGIIYTVPITVRGVRVRIGGRDAATTGVGTLPAGRSVALAASVFGLPRSSAPGVRWTSSDPAVATVDEHGVLHTRLLGRTTLSATAVADPFLRGSVVLDVTAGRRTGPVLGIASVTGDSSVIAVAPDAVGGTIAVTVQVDPTAFPAGAKAELSLGGRAVATRALSGTSLTFAVPTAAHDSLADTALFRNGPSPLVVRVLTPSGTLAGRVERLLVLENAGGSGQR